MCYTDGALRRRQLVYPFGRVVLRLLPVWAAILAGSIALTVLAGASDRLPGDLDLLRRAQEPPVPGMPLSRFVRLITTTQVVLALGAALVAALWLGRRQRLAALLALGLIVLPILQTGLKEIVDRPRPPAELVDLWAGFSSDSFPSGHVMSGVFFYGFLFYASLVEAPAKVVGRLLAAASAAVLALVGWVNVYVGVHWPSDVVGGYGWGLTLLLPVVGLDAMARETRRPLLRTPGLRRL